VHIKVIVVLEYITFYGYQSENLEAFDYLRENDIVVSLNTKDDTNHLKLIVIDEKIVFIGSHNWSESSLYYYNEVSVKIINQEIGEIIRDRV
jgi:phosphatidylserine/phosphatidylglycerophosphate/cardiolipin synthase-like enzyme